MSLEMELINKNGEQGGYIVICGLSASGKTSLVQRWQTQLAEFFKVPEHTDFLDTENNLSLTPSNKTQKKQKQNLIFELDILRSQWAKQKVAQSKWIISDKDFTSALAYTYAEYRLGAENQIFDWLVKKYVQQLHSGSLYLADYYFYLDLPLKMRVNRRRKDQHRVRKSTFFEPDFAMFQREFYVHLFNHQSNSFSLPGYIIDASQKPDEVYQQCLLHFQQAKCQPKVSLDSALNDLLSKRDIL